MLLPLQIDFMQQALLISVLVAVPAALLSCFLVLKGWALMGDAISHAVFPGVVLAYMAGLPFAVGAFSAGMCCALSVGYLADNCRVKRDTIMGIVFSGMFGLGMVLYTKIQSDVHLDHILFGDMLGAGWADIAETAVISAVVIGVIALRRKDLLLHAFDPILARTIGLPTRLLHYGLLALLSLTIVAAQSRWHHPGNRTAYCAGGHCPADNAQFWPHVGCGRVGFGGSRSGRCLAELLSRQCSGPDHCRASVSCIHMCIRPCCTAPLGAFPHMLGEQVYHR